MKVAIALLVLCYISAVYCKRCRPSECIDRCEKKLYISGRCAIYMTHTACECTNRCSASLQRDSASACRALCKKKGLSGGTCLPRNGQCHCSS